MTSSRVLIVAPKEDVHALAVASALHTYDAATWILDIQDFPTSASSSLTLAPRYLRALYDRQDDTLDLAALTSVWWRRAAPTRPPSLYTGLDHTRFVQVECDHLIQGLLWSLDAVRVNEPAADYLASRKVVQLRTALSVGLHLPETLITTKPQEAWRFIQAACLVVFKRVGASSGPASKTRIADFSSAEQLATIATCPTMFQRYISGGGDARVSVVGQELWAVHIESQSGPSPEDSRFDLTVPHRAIELPSKVASEVREFMQRLNLAYGAIDFGLDADGRWWFLEVNPSGQFLYPEEKTGLQIKDSVARFLTNPARLPSASLPAYH
jgi:hypothetical protein